MVRAPSRWLALLVLTACSAQSRLEHDGPTPYVRCLQGAAPDAREIELDGRKLVIDDRLLAMEGKAPVTLAVLSGPGLGPALTALARTELAKSGADLVLLLGGLGDTETTAKAALQELTKLPMPVLFVAGGRDRWPVLRAAFESLEDAPRIIDATALRELRIGSHTLIPVGGAESGRYALDSAACGFGSEDLEDLAEGLGPVAAGQRRTLVSWHAPAAPNGKRGVTRTDLGKDTGSFALARFMKRIGATSSLAAWPTVQAGRPALDAAGAHLERLVVPRLWGPRLERDDGSRPASGHTMLAVEPGGLRLLQ